MKTRTNFGHLVLAVLGLALCLADATSAAERDKTIRTQDHRGGAVSGQLTGTFGNQVVYGAAAQLAIPMLQLATGNR
jgi:ABC-type sugar transport system substrate-binding protein